MGRAGFQHRWEYGSDSNGFQPVSSGETEVHNARTTCSYPDNNTHPHADAYIHTVPDCYPKAHLHLCANTYVTAYADAYIHTVPNRYPKAHLHPTAYTHGQGHCCHPDNDTHLHADAYAHPHGSPADTYSYPHGSPADTYSYPHGSPADTYAHPHGSPADTYSYPSAHPANH
jgi:hypothetical protein